jgi:hypothetical protein
VNIALRFQVDHLRGDWLNDCVSRRKRIRCRNRRADLKKVGNQSATLYFVRCDSKIDLGVCGFAKEGSYLSNATVIALPAILRWIASTARGTGLFALSGGENGVSSIGSGPNWGALG